MIKNIFTAHLHSYHYFHSHFVKPRDTPNFIPVTQIVKYFQCNSQRCPLQDLHHRKEPIQELLLSSIIAEYSLVFLTLDHCNLCSGDSRVPQDSSHQQSSCVARGQDDNS